MKELNDNILFSACFPNVRFGKLIKSPLREDKHPSFCFYKTKTGRIEYKDFGTGNQGSLTDLLCFLNNTNYNGLVEMFGGDKFTTTRQHTGSEATNRRDFQTKQTIISITKTKYSTKHTDYWKQYNICQETLDKCNVYPISSFKIGNTLYKADEIAFAYEKLHDGEYLYKIYQPFSKTMKWRNNIPKTLVYDSLIDYTKGGECCIFTKSVKDMMCIYDNCHIPTLCGNSETFIPPSSLIDKLRLNFKKVYILYDNDKTGIEYAQKISALYGLKSIVCTDAKDASDSYLLTKKINTKWLN